LTSCAKEEITNFKAAATLLQKRVYGKSEKDVEELGTKLAGTQLQVGAPSRKMENKNIIAPPNQRL
jgi:hypothetical protein